MGMQINTNMAANNAYRSLSNTQTDLSKSLEKLSSGLRINRAGDDAAGLALSEGLKSQIGGLSVAARNAQDGIGAVQTAEGGLNQAQSILQRLRDLGVQAANDTNNSESRGAIKTEADSLVSELGRIGASTNFNGAQLLDGSKNGAAALNFQVGANGDAASQISVDLSTANVSKIANALKGLDATGAALPSKGSVDGVKFTAASAGVYTVSQAGGKSFDVTLDGTEADQTAIAAKFTAAVGADFTVTEAAGTGIKIESAASGNAGAVTVSAKSGDPLAQGGTSTNAGVALDFTSAKAAQASIELVTGQITSVSSARAELGASQNRLESAVQTINVAKENLTASNSRIRDTDMAEEMVKFTRNNILSQAGTAMLAQANQSNQGVLQLLR
jgi:flagellin